MPFLSDFHSWRGASGTIERALRVVNRGTA
jgi:hypothetical protein